VCARRISANTSGLCRYETAFSSISTGSIILNMLLGLMSELGSTAIAVLYNLRRGIDVFEIMLEIDHLIILFTWGGGIVFACFAALWAFKTVPNVVYCSSEDPCDCGGFAFPLYEEVCKYAQDIKDALDVNITIADVLAARDNNSTDGKFGMLRQKENLVSNSLGEIANTSTIAVGAMVVVVMVGIICITLNFIQRQKVRSKLFEHPQGQPHGIFESHALR